MEPTIRAACSALRKSSIEFHPQVTGVVVTIGSQANEEGERAARERLRDARWKSENRLGGNPHRAVRSADPRSRMACMTSSVQSWVLAFQLATAA